jgi:hypothetical protein
VPRATVEAKIARDHAENCNPYPRSAELRVPAVATGWAGGGAIGLI